MTQLMSFTNADAFGGALSAWAEQVEQKAHRAVRELVKAAFTHLVLNTPQYTGNMAASWKVSVGEGSVNAYTPTHFKAHGGIPGKFSDSGERETYWAPYQMGSLPAFTEAWNANHSEISQLSLWDAVRGIYISNSTPYTEMADDRTSASKTYALARLREVNQRFETVAGTRDFLQSFGRFT